MGISSSFADSIDALKRNPVLFVAALVVSALSVAALVVQATYPPENAGLLSSGASFVVQLISLLFVGGAYAMARDGLRGRTSLGTLVEEGKEHYVSLLGATILLAIVAVVSMVVVLILGFIGIFAVGPSVVGGDATGLGLVLSGLYLLGFLPIFFLQFYGPAVVVSGASAVESIKRSFGVVRRNLLRTLGFDLVLVAVMLVGSSPFIALYATKWDELMASPQTFSPFASLDGTTLAAFAAAMLVLYTLTAAFTWTYQVAVYEDFAARTDRDGGESGSTDAAVGSPTDL